MSSKCPATQHPFANAFRNSAFVRSPQRHRSSSCNRFALIQIRVAKFCKVGTSVVCGICTSVKAVSVGAISETEVRAKYYALSGKSVRKLADSAVRLTRSYRMPPLDNSSSRSVTWGRGGIRYATGPISS